MLAAAQIRGSRAKVGDKAAKFEEKQNNWARLNGNRSKIEL